METRIRGADGNLALVLARGERQSVGRRAVHILAVKHKIALVGLARPRLPAAVVSSIVNVDSPRRCTVVS